MAEYIEREALLTKIAKGTIITDDIYGMGIMAGVDAVTRMVLAQPAADVSPVVRCKDCQFARYNSCNETWRCVSYSGMMRRVDENDFCSYGEPREEGGADG